MKTSVIEVHDMLSVLSVDEVEKRIGKVPGVESVTVNYAAGSATVRYDETRLEVADIKSAVRQGGYEAATPAASEGGGHEGHTASGAPPTAPAPPAPTTPAVASAGARPPSAGTAEQDKALPDAAPPPTQKRFPAAPDAAPAAAAPKSAPDAVAPAPADPAGGEQHDKHKS